MIEWMFRALPAFVLRVAVTLSACYVLERVIHARGYRVEFTDLLISAVCIIVTMHFWFTGPSRAK